MKQTQDKWVFNFEENQLETQDGKVITVIDEHHGSLKDINLIASAPEMLNALKSIQKIANDTMPSSAYLRHDSGLYNEDKVYLYGLCKTILEKCHTSITKAGGE